MALDLTKAAQASPTTELKLADQRGQVDKPVFLVSDFCCRGTKVEPWALHSKCGPRSPYSQPPTLTRINKPSSVAGTVTQTNNKPDSRASTTPRRICRKHFSSHTQVPPDRRAQQWSCQAGPGTMLSDCQHQEPSLP